MARTRQIKPHFLHSNSMSKVSIGAQLTFIRLWLVVDDAGRAEDFDRPLYWPAKLFPSQPDVKEQVAGWLDELERVGCIVRYRLDGKSYLRVVNWRRRQKIAHPTPSRLPAQSSGIPEALASDSRTPSESIARNVPESPQP